MPIVFAWQLSSNGSARTKASRKAVCAANSVCCEERASDSINLDRDIQDTPLLPALLEAVVVEAVLAAWELLVEACEAAALPVLVEADVEELPF